jgi:hypothetical protein
VASRLECSTAMPTVQEVEDLLTSGARATTSDPALLAGARAAAGPPAAPEPEVVDR